MSDWGAPTKQRRVIAAHKAPKVPLLHKVKVFARDVRILTVALWRFNRRLFWSLGYIGTGLLMLAGFAVWGLVELIK